MTPPHQVNRSQARPLDPAGLVQQLGNLTRQLHDGVQQRGLMPRLQQAAEGLPDARSRLSYVASKTAGAAERVLDAVERAKAEQAAIAVRARRLAAAPQADALQSVASDAVLDFVGEVQARSVAIDAQLTDIMLAQDFHDLTSQVVARVVTLVGELEVNLLQLLLQVMPAAAGDGLAGHAKRQVRQVRQIRQGLQGLQGPVLGPEVDTGALADQAEVDELLASLGF